MYRFVVDMFACPAFVITAIGDRARRRVVRDRGVPQVMERPRALGDGRGLESRCERLPERRGPCREGGRRRGPTVIVNGVIGDYEEAARKIQTALLRIQNREGGLGFQENDTTGVGG
jgi:hypothetical protein